MLQNPVSGEKHCNCKEGKTQKKSVFHIKGSVWQEKDMNVLGQKKTQVKSADMTMAHSF